jgi:hypothetical protein
MLWRRRAASAMAASGLPLSLRRCNARTMRPRPQVRRDDDDVGTRQTAETTVRVVRDLQARHAKDWISKASPSRRGARKQSPHGCDHCGTKLTRIILPLASAA